MSFDIDFKYGKNAGVFLEKVNRVTTMNMFLSYITTSKYLPLIHRYIGLIKEKYPKYNDYLKDNNPSIMLYNSISMFFLNSHIVIEKYKDLLSFEKVYIASSDISVLEAILYQTVNKKYDITHVFLNDCNTSEMKKKH